MSSSVSDADRLLSIDAVALTDPVKEGPGRPPSGELSILLFARLQRSAQEFADALDPELGERKRNIHVRRYFVAALLVMGFGYRRIARRLGIGDNTARSDVRAIRKKWREEFNENVSTIRGELGRKLREDEFSIREKQRIAMCETPEFDELRKKAEEEDDPTLMPRPNLKHWINLQKLLHDVYEMVAALNQIGLNPVDQGNASKDGGVDKYVAFDAEKPTTTENADVEPPDGARLDDEAKEFLAKKSGEDD